jgi:DNA invertase Pin-like site-specific DNA recombinase
MARRPPLRGVGAFNARPRFVAYFRVSTDKQGSSGLGIEAQREAVSRYAVATGGLVIAEFTEVETGTNKRRRPQMAMALGACRLRRATLLIAKLDRLARNLYFIAGLLEKGSGVDFVACDNPHATKALIQMMAVFAEYEAEAIATRTRDALAVVKAAILADGHWISRRTGIPITKLGNPGLRRGDRFGDARAARKARTARADQYADDVAAIIDEAKAAGCNTLGKIAKALIARGIETASGGAAWDRTKVRRVLARRSIKM